MMLVRIAIMVVVIAPTALAQNAGTEAAREPSGLVRDARDSRDARNAGGAPGRATGNAKPGAAKDDPWALIEPKEIAAPASRPAAMPATEAPPESDTRRTLRRSSTGVTKSSGAEKSASDASGTAGWLRTTVSLAAVVAVILFLAWGSKAVTSGRFALRGRVRRPGLIEVVSRTALSPRQSVCLVRVGRRMVLVGVGPETVQTLDVITAADEVAQLAGSARDYSEAADSRTFQRGLEAEAKRYSEEPAAKHFSDEPAAKAGERSTKAVAAPPSRTNESLEPIEAARTRLAETLVRARSRVFGSGANSPKA